MNTKEEAAYERGSRAAWTSLLSKCIHELGYDEDLKMAVLVSEREAAIAALRSACEEWGDNDWNDRLHLADIIEKHLCRHFEGK